MKTLFVGLILFFMTQISHALVQFEVQPLSLKARAQVVGVQVSVDAGRAIVFTGEAAKQVAMAAGVAIDTTKQMIVMTGTEAAELVGTAIGAAYVGGKLVLITTAAFGQAALELALGVITTGAKYTWLAVTTGFTVGKAVIYYTLQGLKVPFYVITETGLFLTRVSAGIVVGTVEFLCLIPNYFGLGLLMCE